MSRLKSGLGKWLGSSPWRIAGLLALCLALLLAAVAPFWLRNTPRVLPYGQFRRELAAGGIASARVGPSAIEGLLTARDAAGRPVRYRVSRVGMEQDGELVSLLDAHIPDGQYEAESAPSPLQTIVLPGLLAIGLFGGFVWVLSRSGGMGSALAFVRSRPRVYSRAADRVSFDDVAGSEEVVAELREVVEFLRSPERFRSLGGRIPKGVLLVGAPGTGKTLLARAVAGEADVPFFSLSGSDFVELFVGVGAARVRSLFARAAARCPCLIFIDELDAIGKARGSGGPGGHDERDQTLNQLLVEMDGFDANRGIILLAATNRPETLDPALVRPGRFDRQIVVDRPDLAGREQILKVHARAVPLDDSIDLRQVAAMTSGFVGADLANLVNEAALLAARRGKSIVGISEFEEGIERLIAGPERRRRLLRPEEKTRIAYHEAGHALVSYCLPQTDPVRKVSIIGRGNGALGYTLYRPEEDHYLRTRTALENAICCLLAGTLAEELVLGEPSDGCTSDLQHASRIARRMVAEFGMSESVGRLSYGNEPKMAPPAGEARWSEQTLREIDLEMRRVIEEAQRRTLAILRARRDTLDRIAARLLQQETIDGDDLAAICSAPTAGTRNLDS